MPSAYQHAGGQILRSTGVLQTCLRRGVETTPHVYRSFSRLRTCLQTCLHAILVNVPSLQVALHAVPNRTEFYNRISEGGSHDTLDMELARWLVGLHEIVEQLRGFLESGKYGKV